MPLLIPGHSFLPQSCPYFVLIHHIYILLAALLMKLSRDVYFSNLLPTGGGVVPNVADVVPNVADVVPTVG